MMVCVGIGIEVVVVVAVESCSSLILNSFHALV